ncbi:MAG: hypothetical protein IJX93_05700 [Clostridia bacterium]|nr:hypothetical protein [Clostridia bacterium]MBQ8333250.1 hypothetical protein [Clostridia bacterium]MBQ8370558.1 hypothetical protein [Clostridia bacterium]MBQ8512284.1 hypothetical protein [Clostridia bacterium]
MEKSMEKALDSAGKKAKTAVREMTSLYDDFRKTHPAKDALCVRKKFAMKDVCFRKNQPDVEVFRWELAFDVEMYVLLLLLAGTGVWLTWRWAQCRKLRRRMASLE